MFVPNSVDVKEIALSVCKAALVHQDQRGEIILHLGSYRRVYAEYASRVLEAEVERQLVRIVKLNPSALDDLGRWIAGLVLHFPHEDVRSHQPLVPHQVVERVEFYPQRGNRIHVVAVPIRKSLERAAHAILGLLQLRHDVLVVGGGSLDVKGSLTALRTRRIKRRPEPLGFLLSRVWVVDVVFVVQVVADDVVGPLAAVVDSAN